MWMMGYNDGGEFNMPDAFSGRKLRPLMPRPATAAAAPPPPNPSPSLSRIHATDFITINHHLVSTAIAAEQNKRDHFNAQQVVVSSRWNPTPEQLQTLEELYRRGTRTPSAEQIQHITAQLRRYGKIEGKNVFYWFQNHKARERQKRRRQLESAADENPRNTDQNPERKESTGASRTGFEVEQTKNWASPTNCSTLPEKTVSSRQRAAKAAAVAECRADHGWVHFDEAGLQQRRSLLMERNDTWQTMMHHEQFPNCSSSPPPTNLIINIPSITAAAPAAATTSATTVVETKLIKPYHQDLNISFIASFREEDHVDNGDRESEVSYEESQTLQLFPLTRGDGYENVAEKETLVSTSSSMDASIVTPYQFFEFLPMKN